jgi:hypothetical protein
MHDHCTSLALRKGGREKATYSAPHNSITDNVGSPTTKSFTRMTAPAQGGRRSRVSSGGGGRVAAVVVLLVLVLVLVMVLVLVLVMWWWWW